MPITTLFLDVGGVVLTNGWDHHARRRAAKQDRHGLVFVQIAEGLGIRGIVHTDYMSTRAKPASCGLQDCKG
jgi:hypothetical protein